MADPSQSALSVDERAVLERFVAILEARLGERLQAVWLFGSRARGDIDRSDDSDVDVLVIADDASWQSKVEIRSALDVAARELALARVAWSFSVHVQTPEWLRQRREIRSFFIAEVDRDKIVLSGQA
jgi:predicted nucleotidyltransferase